MFEKILVATSFDDLSQKVEDCALQMAKWSGGHCNLVHAIEPIDHAEDDPETKAFYDGLQSKSAGQLEEISARFGEAGVSCEATVLIGKRWQVLTETAESWGADLIVIGSRPTIQDGAPRLGSTSHQVFFAGVFAELRILQATL